MTLTELNTLAELLEHLVTAGAIVVGGGFAYKKLFVEAQHEESLSVRLETQAWECGEADARLLEVRAYLVNCGKVPCQIDRSRSYLELTALVIDGREVDGPEPRRLPSDTRTVFNVPVGASWQEVELVRAHHPGVYRVVLFLAQTPEGTRQFHKRIGRPYDEADLSGWPSEILVSTESLGGAGGPREAGANPADRI